jgi:hypothetical protein
MCASFKQAQDASMDVLRSASAAHVPGDSHSLAPVWDLRLGAWDLALRRSPFSWHQQCQCQNAEPFA